jgi:3-dehydroquinate synthetase
VLQSNFDGNQLLMEVSATREITIQFDCIYKFLEKHSASRKIVFIDPLVLSINDRFIDLELCCSHFSLIPTNIQEFNKDLESLCSILKVFESQGIGRRDCLICAIGGGALLDTISFAASIYRRGIHIVKVPTTLLGIVDASIGIKTGVNFLGQRNRVGTYHFDYDVLIDPALLRGLSKGLLRQGLGEIFKIAVIKSRSLFELLETHVSRLEELSFYSSIEGESILRTSILLMLDELHENPKETNLQRCVDFGHSFSPLIEMISISTQTAKAIPHGYAVAFDCLFSSTLSYCRGMLPQSEYFRIHSLYTNFDFDLKNPLFFDVNLIWSSLVEITKHRNGQQNLPLPISIGEHRFVQDVSYEELRKCRLFLNSIQSY